MNASKPLSDTDLSVLNALAAAGNIGLSREDLCVTHARAGAKGSIRNFLARARDHGHTIASMRVGYENGAHVFRYALIDVDAPALSNAPRSVTHIVTDILRLGATPGTQVSLPYMSCLDASQAPGWES